MTQHEELMARLIAALEATGDDEAREREWRLRSQLAERGLSIVETHALTALQADSDRKDVEIAGLRVAGGALIEKLDLVLEAITPMFAEMELVRGRGPYSGPQLGEELEALRSLLDSKAKADGDAK